jgi:uncharacterized membrane protein YedE/YeeE
VVQRCFVPFSTGYLERATEGNESEALVGIGTSIFLIAVGAILKFAVTADVSGVQLDTVGLILMVVGIIGLLLSLFWMTVWADRRRAVVRDGGVVRDRDVVERDVY